MSAAGHTPGPWVWNDQGELVAINVPVYEGSPSPKIIVETDGGHYGPHGADKPLIAAAPDLLAVAKRAREWIAGVMVDELGWPRERTENPPIGSHLHALDEAIAKAHGGTT